MDYMRSPLSQFLVRARPQKLINGAPKTPQIKRNPRYESNKENVNKENIQWELTQLKQPFFKDSEPLISSIERQTSSDQSMKNLEDTPQQKKPKMHQKSKSQEFYPECLKAFIPAQNLQEQRNFTSPDLCVMISSAEKSVMKLLRIHLDLQRRVDFQAWRHTRIQVAQSLQADHFKSLADFKHQRNREIDEAKQKIHLKKQKTRETLTNVLEQIKNDKHQKAHMIKQEKAYYRILIEQSKLDKQIQRQTKIIQQIEDSLQNDPLNVKKLQSMKNSKNQALKEIYETRLSQLKDLEAQLISKIEQTIIENKQLLEKGRLSIPF